MTENDRILGYEFSQASVSFLIRHQIVLPSLCFSQLRLPSYHGMKDFRVHVKYTGDDRAANPSYVRLPYFCKSSGLSP